MEMGLAETLEFDSPPSDSVDSNQTLDVSSNDSPPPPPPPPPMQTLNGLLNSLTLPSKSDFNCGKALGDHSESALFLSVESSDDDDEKEKEGFNDSPVYSGSAFSSSHWSSTSWSSRSCTKTSASGWLNWPSMGDTVPSTSYWSETWLSGGDAMLSESDWPEALPLLEETETKSSSISVSLTSPSFCEIKPAIVGAGLANLGNTCFLNAILQCFTHTVPLVQGLRSYNHPICERATEGFCVLCALRNQIELSLASMGTVETPWYLVANLSNISSDFQRFRQEDAHEFLQCLLGKLDSFCTDSKWKETTLSSVDENMVKRVFGGRLVSKLQCCNCGHCSDTYEPLIDLSLEIENVDSLHSALESFTKVETIEDLETKFTCESCKEEVSVEKQLILDQAPSVAAFHLKRFKTDGFYVEKIDKFVEFPLELDLLPYAGGSQNNKVKLKYYLYAVVVHIGFSSTSGHYYCFIRSGADTWFMLDDSKVTRVREDFVLSQEAYILFYAKQGTPWFSSYMETEKSSVDPNISNNSPKSVLDNMDHLCLSSPNAATHRSCEVNEAREDGFGIYANSFNGCTHNSVEANEANEANAGNSSSRTSSNVENKFSLVGLRDHYCNQSSNEVENSANVTPLTPPRPPSLDTYAEEPPVVACLKPRDHLMPEKPVPSKRKLVNNLEDSERKQARKIVKGMPNYRSSKLLAATEGKGSRNSKMSTRNELSLKRNNKPSRTRCKTNYMRTLAAGW